MYRDRETNEMDVTTDSETNVNLEKDKNVSNKERPLDKTRIYEVSKILNERNAQKNLDIFDINGVDSLFEQFGNFLEFIMFSQEPELYIIPKLVFQCCYLNFVKIKRIKEAKTFFKIYSSILKDKDIEKKISKCVTPEDAVKRLCKGRIYMKLSERACLVLREGFKNKKRAAILKIIQGFFHIFSYKDVDEKLEVEIKKQDRVSRNEIKDFGMIFRAFLKKNFYFMGNKEFELDLYKERFKDLLYEFLVLNISSLKPREDGIESKSNYEKVFEFFLQHYFLSVKAGCHESETEKENFKDLFNSFLKVYKTLFNVNKADEETFKNMFSSFMEQNSLFLDDKVYDEEIIKKLCISFLKQNGVSFDGTEVDLEKFNDSFYSFYKLNGLCTEDSHHADRANQEKQPKYKDVSSASVNSFGIMHHKSEANQGNHSNMHHFRFLYTKLDFMNRAANISGISHVSDSTIVSHQFPPQSEAQIQNIEPKPSNIAAFGNAFRTVYPSKQVLQESDESADDVESDESADDVESVESADDVESDESADDVESNDQMPADESVKSSENMSSNQDSLAELEDKMDPNEQKQNDDSFIELGNNKIAEDKTEKDSPIKPGSNKMAQDKTRTVTESFKKMCRHELKDYFLKDHSEIEKCHFITIPKEDIVSAADVTDMYVVCGFESSLIRVWSISDQWLCGMQFDEHCILKGHKGIVFSVAIDSNQKILISGSNDETVRIWDLELHSCLSVHTWHSAAVYSVCSSPTSKCILSSSADSTAVLYWYDEFIPKSVYKYSKENVVPIYVVKFHPNGIYFATAAADNVITLWTIHNNKRPLRLFNDHDEKVNTFSFSPCGKYLTAGDNAGWIFVWEIQEAEPVVGFNLDTSGVRDLSYDKSGNVIIAVSYGISWCIYHPRSIKEKLLLYEQPAETVINSVHFTLENKLVLIEN